MPTLWPFCPAPEFVESLQWVNDIIPTYSADQRIALTDAPRQMFSLAHVWNFEQYERAKLLVQLVGGGSWYLPQWQERQRVTVSGGASSITIDTTASDYRAGGYACLWSSDEDCEIVEIDTVGASSLTLVGTVSQTYTNGFCMPALVAYCPEGLAVDRSVQRFVAASTEWRVYDTIDLAAAGSYPTYRTYPVMTDCPRIGAGTIAERLVRDVDIVDNGLADPFFDTLSDRLSRTIGVAWMPQTLPDLWDLRGWLHSLYGQQKAFWLPDWTRGMTLMSNIAPASTTITVRGIGLNGAAETGDLYLLQQSGTVTRLRYTSVAPSGSTEILTLSGAAGVTIAAADVRMLCQLRLVRLAQSRIELHHRHTGTRQITTVFALCDEVPFA